MESFAALKRRTTDLLNSLPQSLPSMPLTKSHHSHTMKGTWEKISVPPLPRSSHSIDIVAGTAYIFGGEINPRKPVDNDMHVVTLPFSGASADYYAIKAKPAKPAKPNQATQKPTAGEGEPSAEPSAASTDKLDEIPLSPAEGRSVDKGKGIAAPSIAGDVPAPRVGHASAVIGSRIFIFGGRGGPAMDSVDEGGRVWVFDTKTHLWSYLDPVSPVDAVVDPDGERRPACPAPRCYHSAVATDKPNDFGENSHGHSRPVSRKESWKEWAKGDSDEVGIPQRPIVGAIAAHATDADEEGFGTFIIHGGCLSKGRANDTWAFDVRSRVWQELPPAPGKPRGGAALCISKSRLYRFGGFNGESEEGGQLDVLDLVVETFDDQRVASGEVNVTARGAWRSLVQYTDVEYPAGREQEASANAEAAPLAQSQSPNDVWPGPRSVASLEALDVGGGREYLVLMLGERDPSNAGHAAAGKFWDDVWVFQVPPQGMSTASLTDAVLQAVGRKSGEGKWTKVEIGPYDEEDNASVEGPGQRGWIASATMGELEENGIVIWGGLDGENRRLGDGWIFRLG